MAPSICNCPTIASAAGRAVQHHRQREFFRILPRRSPRGVAPSAARTVGRNAALLLWPLRAICTSTIASRPCRQPHRRTNSPLPHRKLTSARCPAFCAHLGRGKLLASARPDFSLAQALTSRKHLSPARWRQNHKPLG